MPAQPDDPIHYEMKIPPEPKSREEDRDSTKKHGDKIDTGDITNQANKEPEDKKPE